MTTERQTHLRRVEGQRVWKDLLERDVMPAMCGIVTEPKYLVPDEVAIDCERCGQILAEIVEAGRQGRLSLREQVRAVMRGEKVENSFAPDLIREVTEWHDGGRLTLGETRRKVLSDEASCECGKPGWAHPVGFVTCTS